MARGFKHGMPAERRLYGNLQLEIAITPNPAGERIGVRRCHVEPTGLINFGTLPFVRGDYSQSIRLKTTVSPAPIASISPSAQA